MTEVTAQFSCFEIVDLVSFLKFMEIFFRLLFGHLLADFTFQTNFIADWKRRSIFGLLTHVLIHPICYVVVAWPYLNTVWVRTSHFYLVGWVCILIAAFLHFVEDWVRVKMVNGTWPDNTVFYIWDQVVHIVILWVLSPTSRQSLSNHWFIIGSLFVWVTHCATVTVWFIEKDISGIAYPETEEKYFSMLYRLVVWLTFFLPSPWWIFALLFILFTFTPNKLAKRIDFRWANFVMGLVLTIGAGVISRFFLQFHF